MCVCVCVQLEDAQSKRQDRLQEKQKDIRQQILDERPKVSNLPQEESCYFVLELFFYVMHFVSTLSDLIQKCWGGDFIPVLCGKTCFMLLHALG